MQLRRFVQNSSLYLLANLASRAVGFLMIPLYSRALSPAEYGLIELIELTIQVVALCFGLQSIGGALIRIYQDARTVSDKGAVVSTSILGSSIANIVIALVAMSLAGPLGAHLSRSGTDASLLRVGFAAMAFSNLVEVALVYQRLRDRVALCVSYSLVQLVAALSLNILLVVHLRMGVWGFVLSKLAVSGIGCLWLLSITLREVGVRWSTQAGVSMVRFGAPLILAQLSFFLIHFADRFFIGAFRDLSELGAYALAYRFAFLISIVIGEPFGKVWSVSLYQLTETAGWENRFARVARYLIFILCFSGLALSLFGNDIIRWVAAPAYHSAGAVLPILVFGYVAREAGDFFRNVMYINKRSRRVGGIAAASALINLALNLLLIPSFGMMGAAWATMATWTVYLGCCWVGAQREHAIPFPARAFLLTAGACVAIYFAVAALPPMAPALHAGVQAIWLGAFVALLWVSGYFSEQERTFLRQRVVVTCEGLGIWVRQRV